MVFGKISSHQIQSRRGMLTFGWLGLKKGGQAVYDSGKVSLNTSEQLNFRFCVTDSCECQDEA